MSITPGGVHDEHTGVFTDGLGESLGTVFDDDVTPSLLTRNRAIEGGTVGVVAVLEGGNNDLILETGFTLLTSNGTAVDGEITEVSEQLLRAVLALYELEKVGRVVDKLLNRD